MIECRTMTGPDRYDAFTLMQRFRTDEAALGDALALFLERPDYGFVWLAYVDDVPAACVSVAYAISTETGGVIADVRDLWVAPEHRRLGVGSALLVTLQGRLDQLQIRRIDALVPDDAALRALLLARGYTATGVRAFSLARR